MENNEKHEKVRKDLMKAIAVNDWTLGWVAKRVRVSRPTLSNYIHGKKKIISRTLWKLENFLYDKIE